MADIDLTREDARRGAALLDATRLPEPDGSTSTGRRFDEEDEEEAAEEAAGAGAGAGAETEADAEADVLETAGGSDLRRRAGRFPVNPDAWSRKLWSAFKRSMTRRVSFRRWLISSSGNKKTFSRGSREIADELFSEGDGRVADNDEAAAAFAGVERKRRVGMGTGGTSLQHPLTCKMKLLAYLHTNHPQSDELFCFVSRGDDGQGSIVSRADSSISRGKDTLGAYSRTSSSSSHRRRHCAMRSRG